MTKILTTIGPVSSGKNLKFSMKSSGMMRFNMSHNSINWHKKNIDLIKKIDPNKYILVDIPGAKPRTLNNKPVKIRKGEKIIFGYKSKKLSSSFVPISNPLPKLIKKNNKLFSLSDGSFLFKFISLKNNILTGVSLQNFLLQPKKGLNIPYSIYDDNFQSKVYVNFIKKISNLNYDCIGLSFVQSANIVKILKNKYKNTIFISKIENYLGYSNRKEIIKESDAIMIDRGDLAAEIGNDKLTEYCEKIINDCKKIGKPVIIATENLNSLIDHHSPSKSDILNLDYFISKKVDFMMLSDETATSSKWKNTLTWLKKYLNLKKRRMISNKAFDLSDILQNLNNHVLVIFTKKGFFLEKFKRDNFSNLIVFTENRQLSKIINLKDNIYSFYTKFPKTNIDKFLYKNIKNKKDIIFKNNKSAFLINVTFPRKESRANTFIILSKEDF